MIKALHSGSYAEQMDAQIKWLGQWPFNYTLTLHYHQWLPNNHGGWRRITRETATRTTNRFMNGLDRALFRLMAKSKSKYLSRAAFHEFDVEGRHHTHVLLVLPGRFSIADLKRAADHVRTSCEWIDRTVFIEAMDPGTQEYLAAYCHKDGLDSFCPEATRLIPPADELRFKAK